MVWQVVLSRVGYVLLQVGDVEGAGRAFQAAEALKTTPQSTWKLPGACLQALLYRNTGATIPPTMQGFCMLLSNLSGVFWRFPSICFRPCPFSEEAVKEFKYQPVVNKIWLLPASDAVS